MTVVLRPASGSFGEVQPFLEEAKGIRLETCRQFVHPFDPPGCNCLSPLQAQQAGQFIPPSFGRFVSLAQVARVFGEIAQYPHHAERALAAGAWPATGAL